MAEDQRKDIQVWNWLVRFGLIAVFFLILVGFSFALPDGKLHVYFLDIGQGDAELIQTPGGKRILVDAGPEGNIENVLPTVMPYFDRKLDMIVLTHPHMDHIAGFLKVLPSYHVDTVLFTGLSTDLPEYNWFLEHVKSDTKFIAVADRDYQIEPGLNLDVLWPIQSMANLAVDTSKLNPSSVVFRLNYGSTHMLFTGDMDAFVEQKVLATGDDIRSGVLKVAHHGSRYSSTKPFLDAVNPRMAIISSGAGNVYKHPHRETLDNLQTLGIQTYRTDTFGTVEVICGKQDDCEVRYEKQFQTKAISVQR